MARSTTILGFSVPPSVAAAYARLAKRERTTKSELFRRMVEVYQAALDEDELHSLQRRMSQNARRKGVFTERDVEKLVFKDR